MTQNVGLIDDCFVHDKDRLRHGEALTILKERLTPLVDRETIHCGAALNRILAEDIFTPHDVPLHRNSAVDGYAFCHAELNNGAFPISGRIAAGDLAPLPLDNASAVRIFTGAPMPEGADTVAMQEDCVVTGNGVTIPSGLNPGANCRQAGEDLKQGDHVFSKGTRMKAADMAALASIGRHQVSIFEKLTVALLSSGDEMRVPGEVSSPLAPGEVYDANQPLISALCQPLPVSLSNCGILPDNEQQTFARIKELSQTNDVIITTGGASKGMEDHMLSTLDKLGKRHLWQLAVKPGRPMMFGQIPRANSHNDCMFFGLPGNPVAAMVCFLLYVQPALKALGGANWSEPPRFQVPADFEIAKKKPDRREFLRGHLRTDEDGMTRVNKYGRDGSGLISSLRESDGLIELPEEVTNVEKGELVSFIPFSSF